jgi:hypothetical protein
MTIDSNDLALDSDSSSLDSGSDSNSTGFFQPGKLYMKSLIMVRSNTRGGGLLTSSWRHVVFEREFSNQGQIWISEGAGTPADCAGRAMNLISILTPSRKGELEGNSKAV